MLLSRRWSIIAGSIIAVGADKLSGMDSSHSLSIVGSALRSLEPMSLRLGGLTIGLAGSAIADLMKTTTGPWSALSGATKGIDQIMRLRNPWHDLAMGLKEHTDKLRAVAWPTARIAEQFAGVQGIADIGSVTRHLFEASRLTALADSRRWEFRSVAFGGVESLRVTPAVADFTCVAGLYSTFLSRCATVARPLAPSVLAIPAREYFLSGEGCVDSVENAVEPDDADEECAAAREEIRLHVYATVEEALTALDAGLLKLWHGAVQAALSDNPDKVRHAITSLRELFTQVMHRLAPDEDIEAWSSDPRHFGEKNRPTRRARLLYIVTGLDHDPFTEFLGADIDSLLTLTGAFQSGAHKAETELSLRQMRLVFHRAGSTLCSLIEARLAVG